MSVDALAKFDEARLFFVRLNCYPKLYTLNGIDTRLFQTKNSLPTMVWLFLFFIFYIFAWFQSTLLLPIGSI